ncbi:MAG: DUF2723 domain-containing protein [Deltaproteobacteria bacterium]|jgi:tetratricopeptide (TPR) repeat protein|nr:DUF2723 domain-containing protein [Deltaproteobacteria bacterium]
MAEPDQEPQLKQFVTSNFFLLLIALCLTFVYIASSTPGMGWRDGPEFTVTPTYLDVAHPSGFPTFSLLAKILTWVPLGSIPFKITIFTALMGGISLYLFFLLLKTLHQLDPKPSALLWLYTFPLFFAFHQAVFVSATELEVYSLNTALVLLLLFMGTQWWATKSVGYLYVGGFLYGLSCGNHASMALYLPVLIMLTLWGKRGGKILADAKTHAQNLAYLSIFFLIGLSVYLFLLIRSQTDFLPVDFGRTNTLARFWHHISDAKDSEYHFKGIFNPEDLFFYLKIQYQNLTSPLFFLTLPFFAWGLKYLWRTFQILSVAAIVLILINIGFFYYWIDGTSAFLPSLTTYFIITSLGFGECGRFFQNLKFIPKILGTIMVSLLALGFTLHLASLRLARLDTVSGFEATELFFPDLANLPPESLILEHANWFSFLSLQYVYATRPDISLIFMSGLVQPQYFSYPEPQKLPRVFFPTDEFGNLLSPFTPGYPSLFLNANFQKGRRVFIQYGEDMNILFPYFRPHENLMWMGELLQDSTAGDNALESGEYSRYLEKVEAYFTSFPGDPLVPISPKAPAIMFYALRAVLEYTFTNHRYLETGKVMENFFQTFTIGHNQYLLPVDVVLNGRALIANSYRNAKDFAKAEAVVFELIELRPTSSLNYLLLGLIYDNQDKGPETLAAWEKATQLDPFSNAIAYRYFLALAKYRSIAEAVTFYNQRIEFLGTEGLTFSQKMTQYLRDCLLLPPNVEENPAGNLLFRDNPTLGKEQ